MGVGGNGIALLSCDVVGANKEVGAALVAAVVNAPVSVALFNTVPTVFLVLVLSAAFPAVALDSGSLASSPNSLTPAPNPALMPLATPGGTLGLVACDMLNGMSAMV